MKPALALAVFLAATLVAGPGCKRKQQPPKSMPAQNVQPAGPMTQWPHTEAGARAERKIVTPDDVKNGWKAVRIEVLFKEKNEKKRFDVALDVDFRIPGAGLTLKAGPFLPDFLMGPEQITSASNQPRNPVVRAELIEDGRVIFQGWLFAMHPDIHPFTHDKYAVTLIEGIPR